MNVKGDVGRAQHRAARVPLPAMPGMRRAMPSSPEPASERQAIEPSFDAGVAPLSCEGGSSGSGERRLMLAVLEDGIRTLLKHAHATGGRAARLRREALDWLVVSDYSDVFAFERVCEALAIEPGRLRTRVLGAFQGAPARLSMETMRRG
jgi:hypothetical protein